MVFTMVATSTQKNKSSEFISDFVDGGYDQSCIDNGNVHIFRISPIFCSSIDIWCREQGYRSGAS